MPPTVLFGRWLKLRRAELDLTQWDLAERIGCSRDVIQKIETGARRPSKQIAELLVGCLEIPPPERPAFVRWARLGPEAAPPEATLAALAPLFTRPAEADEQPAPSTLPAALTSLVGREEELAALRRYLLRDDVRLLTLTGPPGIGKSRLGLAVAAHLAGRFRDGVYFVPLETVTQANSVASAIARVVGVKPVGHETIGEAIARHMRSRRALLVLDNFEQVLDAAPQLVQLLSACPGLRALVTSREALHAYGEWRFRVPPLELPNRKRLPDIDLLAGVASVALFLHRAQALKPDLALTAENAATIADICIRLDGLPLAIELAAARVEDLAPQQILAGLAYRLQLLKGDLRYLAPRQQTLRGAIDWSYDLLSPAERLLLGRLAVFVGGWILAAAEAVCADSLLAKEDVLDVLLRLVDRSLVIAKDGRYRLLETIREYALERLSQAGEEETLRTRHAAFYARYVQERFDLILGREQDRGIQEIDAEIDNVRGAWDSALAERRQDLAQQSYPGLLWYYELESEFYDGEAACARAIAALADDPDADPVLLPTLRAYHGYFLGRLGRLGNAREEAERGCAELRQANAGSEMALPLVMLGTIVWQEGDYPRARVLLEESLHRARAVNHRLATPFALFFLGLVAHSSGDDAQADKYFRESLDFSRIDGQPRMLSMISVSSAPTLLALGKYREARERLQEGAAIARSSRIRWLVGVAQGHLGLVLNAERDYAAARTALLEAVALAEESGNRWDRAWAEVSLGDAELGLGNQEEASNHYRAGLTLAMEADAIPIALDALAGLSLLRAQMGDCQGALELAQQVLVHPAGAGNARSRAEEVLQTLRHRPENEATLVSNTFEEFVREILAGG